LVDAFSHLAVNVERMKTLMKKRSAGESKFVYNSMNSAFIEANTPFLQTVCVAISGTNAGIV